jgi:hypothetical protein
VGEHPGNAVLYGSAYGATGAGIAVSGWARWRTRKQFPRGHMPTITLLPQFREHGPAHRAGAHNLTLRCF